MFIPIRRATVLIPSGPLRDLDRKHLFIVTTDPCPQGSLLLVSISSCRPGCDTTCRLFVGDHPFVKRDSFIAYDLARIEGADGLMRGVKNGLLHPREAIDTAIFARICHGITESPFTKPSIRAYYIERTS
jgi:hypothetical protein